VFTTGVDGEEAAPALARSLMLAFNLNGTHPKTFVKGQTYRFKQIHAYIDKYTHTHTHTHTHTQLRLRNNANQIHNLVSLNTKQIIIERDIFVN